MRSILTAWVTCFLLTLSAFGQSDLIVIKTPEEKEAARKAEAQRMIAEAKRIEDANKWKFVVANAEDPPVMWFFQRTRRVRDDVEVWLKVVYPKPITTKGQPPVVYTMDYTVFHCGTGRKSVEQSIGYDKTGKNVVSVASYLLSHREAVNPGSVNEGLYYYFCS